MKETYSFTNLQFLIITFMSKDKENLKFFNLCKNYKSSKDRLEFDDSGAVKIFMFIVKDIT